MIYSDIAELYGKYSVFTDNGARDPQKVGF